MREIDYSEIGIYLEFGIWLLEFNLTAHVAQW